MKANELMIGDWILANGKPRKLKFVAPFFLGADRLMLDMYYEEYIREDGGWDDGFILQDCAYMKDIEPVRITSEILKKNGFRIYGDNAKYEEESDYHGKATVLYVQFHRHGNLHIWREYEFSRDGEQHVIDWYDPKLEFHTLYVHELQHAMRLCGIEKEIEL